jgi:hypothetical protein
VSADVASHQLKDIVIQMQSKMITTLHILLGGAANYEDLLGISKDSRIRAVSALEEQFHRMATAAPLAKGPSMRVPSTEAMAPARPTRPPLVRRLAQD